MRIFEKIRSLFNRKNTELSTRDDKPENKKIHKKKEDLNIGGDRPLGKAFSVTEATLCRTCYGLGKIREDGNKRYLLFPEKLDARYIPFVENDCIEAVYTIDPDNFIKDDNGRFLYEIIDSAQFFMLSKEQKEEISSDLKRKGISYRFPEEIDNYSIVMNILRNSTLLMRNQDSGWFDKEKFLSEILEIKGSNTYKELHLIRLKNGSRYILMINQIVANVVEYGPSFMNLYEPGAVKISYLDGYAFIVPFGRPK
ncbi:MAG: hypothetical protein N2746_03185 [Deltaproteobacteria bacterium]|nr:hypothetical protein [Deltaproteobacteria bacterium]